MYLTTGKFDPGGLIAGGGRQGHAFEGSEDESEPGVRANGLEALERLAEAKVANDVQSDVSVPVNRVCFDDRVIVLRRGDLFSEPLHQQRDRGLDSRLLRPQSPRQESSIHHLAHPRVVCDIGGCDHDVRLAPRGGRGRMLGFWAMASVRGGCRRHRGRRLLWRMRLRWAQGARWDRIPDEWRKRRGPTSPGLAR